MRPTLLTTLLILLTTVNLMAQPDPIKWGKIEKADLEMSAYPEDPEAAAVVLCDFGSVRFDYRRHDGIGLQFERIVRIKILKKPGLEYANVSIPLYKKVMRS